MFIAKLLFAVGHYVVNRKAEVEKKDTADRLGDASEGLVTGVF